MQLHTLILPDGQRITSGGGQTPAIRTVRVTETVNSGYELTPGSVCAAMVVAELYAPQGLTLSSGDELRLLRGEEQVGIFLVEKPEQRRSGILSLTGYDRVIRLDRDLTQWFYTLDGWPYTLQTFAAMVCQECGLSLSGQVQNGDLSIPRFVCPAATGRQLLQWAAEAAGQFVRADGEGNIRFGWYTPAPTAIAPTGDSFYYRGSLQLGSAVKAVDTVLRQGQTGGENPYTLAANPLIPEGADLSFLAGCFPGYQSCTVAVPTACGIRAGHAVEGTDPKGNAFRFLVMKRTSSGGRDTLECTGSPSRLSAEAVNCKPPAQIAGEAVDRQTQADIFRKLTDGGKLQGLYMQDGELYINASYLRSGVLDASLLQTGIIRSADGTVELDLGSNMVTIHGTYDLNGVTYPTKTTLSANGLQGWGQDAFGELVETLSLQPGVSGGATMLTNLYGDGLVLAAATGVTTLGTTGSYTEVLGSSVTVEGLSSTDIAGEQIRIGGKTVTWRANGDGTYTLIGR